MGVLTVRVGTDRVAAVGLRILEIGLIVNGVLLLVDLVVGIADETWAGVTRAVAGVAIVVGLMAWFLARRSGGRGPEGAAPGGPADRRGPADREGR